MSINIIDYLSVSVKNKECNYWNFICPFKDMSYDEWENYKNRGHNFENFPSFVSIKRKEIEYIITSFFMYGYSFLFMYTNNANNSKKNYSNEKNGWFQITTIIFFCNYSMTIVEFNLYEEDMNKSNDRYTPKFQISYAIKIRYSSRNEKMNVSRLPFQDPNWDVSVSNILNKDIYMYILSKNNKNVKDLFNSEFFKNIKSKDPYYGTELLYNFEKFIPNLSYHNYYLHSSSKKKIIEDLINKVSNNKNMKSKYEKVVLLTFNGENNSSFII